MKEFEIEAITEIFIQYWNFIDGQLELIGCPIKPQMQIGITAEDILVNIAHYAYAPRIGEAARLFELYRFLKKIRFCPRLYPQRTEYFR